MSALARVLLVDDDAAIRRLVAMALEDEALQLISCADAHAALAALREAPVALLITDLMMPGLSGFELLERLRDEPALRGSASLVAFSAGLNAERAERLQALGVQTLLDKPVSIARLLAVVREALGAAAPPASAPLTGGAASEAPAAAAVAGAVPAAFGGDAVLYQAFLQACLAQYPQDLAAGDAAIAQGDAPALRRVVHNLKGSLRTLGADTLADAALAIEQGLAADGDLPPTRRRAWQALREALQHFVNKGAA